ncbi:hypothetical protein BDA96_07G164300 [Sorghum bicolor]|uniref:Protein XRI1 n=1 Tax=Sorghum bicolor TaxID=4558 RepID=A0A921U9M8_SORBI|nr:hypothetical protein BDA96_07G164300 [Sorghum bicolor]
METGQAVQESALHAGRQAWWPLDTMACSLDDASTISSSFLLGWDPQLCYFGLGAMGAAAGDSDTHGHARELELFVPKCMESPVSEASTAAATDRTMQKDAAAMPGELDELLMSLWDDSDKELAVGFSSCGALKETSATISSQYDDHSDLSSILPTTLPTSPDKTPTPAQAELSASPTSHCDVDLRTSSDTGVAQHQQQTTRANSSSKRLAPEEEGAEGGESSKRSRNKAPCSTAGTGTVAAYPFDVVRPGGADGSVTLADINRWILTTPARPVRHPVGEFACAPRVSAGNRPAPSGKTVAGFTRLRTAGRGTVTIVRTRG